MLQLVRNSVCVSMNEECLFAVSENACLLFQKLRMAQHSTAQHSTAQQSSCLLLLLLFVSFSRYGVEQS